MLIQENDLSAFSIHENIQKDDTELTMATKGFLILTFSTLTRYQKIVKRTRFKTSRKYD